MNRNRTTRRILAVAAFSVWLGYAGGCEQQVVPVATAVSSGGGIGGAGGAGRGGAGGAVGGAGGVCGTPNPALPLEDCGGTSSVGTGMPIECEWSVCDATDARWTALCTVDGCSCRFDDDEVCTCDFDPRLSSCEAIANCCPSGWPGL